MLVSRDWLARYVEMPADLEGLAQQLTMSGLNHESTRDVQGDFCLDLEVTSNRPDCLGHLGVAREISVLTGKPMAIPPAVPRPSGPSLAREFRLRLDAPELCHRFTLRLVRGVSVAPSPDWLVRCLATIGIESVNNIVDISNFVMFECGQPLHAFDADRIQDRQLQVRHPHRGETLLAIDHKTYSLQPGMCVIADGRRAVGIGGVMGGAETEVSTATRNVLLEAAWFEPRCIRSTARSLNLHSAASFRFERRIDAHQIDWASRRCCELIMQVAGGELAEGVLEAGELPSPPPPVKLRWRRIEEVLGVAIPAERAQSILGSLGFDLKPDGADCRVTVPSWRQDVEREIDLIEEVGRIHGYHHVPDDTIVPVIASSRSHRDRLLARIRHGLAARGLDEAMTASLVPRKWNDAFCPWTREAPLESNQPMLGVLDKASLNLGSVNGLRRSLVPSLLEVFRINDHRQNVEIHLFEMAAAYLPRPGQLPDERMMAALVSEADFGKLKGIVESLVESIVPGAIVRSIPWDDPLLDITRAARLETDGELLGFIGDVSETGLADFSLRRQAAIAELDLEVLLRRAPAAPRISDQSSYPAVKRDLNLIVAEEVAWSELSASALAAAGEHLESIEYRETFRNPARDGEGRKRILFSLVLRSMAGTLTREQADASCRAVVERCAAEHGAQLCT